MLFEILAILMGTYLVGNFVGYGIHWLLHQPYMGMMFRAHSHHHWVIYPPENYLSTVYREPPTGAEQAKFYLTPILLIAAGFLFWHWYYAVLIAAEGAAVLKLNAVVHDNLHIRGHRWEKYRWFWKLRTLHYHHHIEVLTNLGIFSFLPDRVLRTYEKSGHLPTKYLPASVQSLIEPTQ